MPIYRHILFFLLLTFFLPSSLANQALFFFKKNQLSFGYYNKYVLPQKDPKLPSPLFWRSNKNVDDGFSLIYTRNAFHTKKYFSINVGTSLSSWSSQSQVQLALSAFFVFRIWLFHTTWFNPYIDWSIAGPTLLSRRWFGDDNLGGRFIFQDFLGIGAQIGKTHTINISFNMYHYSNGDLFVHNDGFNVPLVLVVGYSF